MSLFNLVFSQMMSSYNLTVPNDSVKPPSSVKYLSSKLASKIIKKTKPTVVVLANEKRQENPYLTQDFSDQEFISGNLVEEFINKYWQQTIFLSIPTSSSDHYVNKLRSDGLTIDKNQKKKLLAEFSKALIIGRIEASLLTLPKTSLYADKNRACIKYTWKKGLNIPLSLQIDRLWSNRRDPGFPTKTQVSLITKLKSNKFPLFTLINSFNQIVVAEPAEELLISESIVDQVFKWYSNRFIWTKDLRPVYEGLFFINPHDVLEYKEYILSKYKNSSTKTGLDVFIGGLDLYYKIARTSPPRVQFRLVPDLTEVGNLVSKYRKKKHLIFHPKQQHGRDYFQGQPIYIIQPILAKSTITNKFELVQYSYKVLDVQNQPAYDSIFMNYETAKLAWHKFREQHRHYHLPHEPQLLVYNLESLLNQYQSDTSIASKDFLFVPSHESYTFTKKNELKSVNSSASRQVMHKVLHAQTWFKRVLWSLTSRQPVNW